MKTTLDLQAGQKFLSIPAILCKKIGNKDARFFRTIDGNTEQYQLECDGKILQTFSKWQFYVLNALFLLGGDRYNTLLANVNERFAMQLTRSDIDRLFEDIKQKQLLDLNEAFGHPLTKPLFESVLTGNTTAGSGSVAVGSIKNVFNKASFLRAGKQTALYAKKGLLNIKAAGNQDNKKAIAKAISEKVSAIKSLDKETVVKEGKRALSFAQWLLQIVFSGNPDNNQNNQVAENAAVEVEKDDDSQQEKSYKKWHVCNPTNFLKKNINILSYGKYLLYPLPFCAFAALMTVVNNASLVNQDINSVVGGYSMIINDVIFGFLIISVAAAVTTASVAYAYGATVKEVSINLFAGFIPRFVVSLDDTDKFERRQKLWLSASPILTRLGLFTVGVFLWDHSRTLNGFMQEFGVTLAWISAISIMFNICPFFKSDGYRFMCTFFNEPNLRGKAFKVLASKWSKGYYVKEDSNTLAVYAMVCGVFTIGFVFAVMSMACYLLNITLGTTSILFIGATMSYVGYKLSVKLKEANENYNKQRKFERWRERILPEDIKAELAPAKPVNPQAQFRKRLAIITLIIAMPFPYPYTPSGQVVLLPITQQQISSDVAGIIDEVFYEGGEYLEKGTLVARLSVNDAEAQLEIKNRQLEQQQAFVDQLKARPSKEEVTLAEQALEVAQVRWGYSEDKCIRQRKLYESGAISLEAMSAIEQVCQVDKQQLSQAQAELEKVKAGVPPEEIAAAEAALEPIKAEIKMHQDQITRSEFRMPFSGKLATLYLKEKEGKYLDRGAPLALAQDESEFKAAIEISQNDAPYVKVGNRVRLKTMAYPDKTFEGVVKAIDSDVQSKTYGEVLKMVITLKSEGNMLKSGMTGYAKVTGDSISIWQLMTQAIYRFITVELWAWLP